MNILGSLGQLYMLILLALLFLGSGLGVWTVISSSLNNKQGMPQKKGEAGQGNIIRSQGTEKTKIGGIKMQNNGWFKLAIFSFVGILVSVAVLGLVSTNNNMADSNVHLQHQQQGLQQNQNAMAGMNGMNGNMQMQGGMNVGLPMGNMQMQGNMNGNMQMQGGMNSMNMPVDYNYMMMQQQLNQMQQQLYMMQQQMQMQGGSMPSNSSMSNMPSSGGGMGMMSMPMGGSSSGSSGGGMGMM
ncbi:hypothetical protein HNQ80_001576 [Anaerosolibacter carboniphilus]|uniref:Uncharacterized protein n=1 Tax=Anaerosolibacter carboniphilus TaxID=1417629 RepID=A0A841KPX3_9FIRM|nr:hypothetical protein [Anaerosolibacter carboniphilus]MBB6215487.1 hypothetical protein [Anaerosolibacter carboniphilus]